mmetsp:Transcript_59477/g.166719  ORF Transcript_59477/g.166719 Transcript_59477/m.166719 type:complete len:300 (+) Transcript_59477:438-1337(+)
MHPRAPATASSRRAPPATPAAPVSTRIPTHGSATATPRPPSPSDPTRRPAAPTAPPPAAGGGRLLATAEQRCAPAPTSRSPPRRPRPSLGGARRPRRVISNGANGMSCGRPSTPCPTPPRATERLPALQPWRSRTWRSSSSRPRRARQTSALRGSVTSLAPRRAPPPPRQRRPPRGPPTPARSAAPPWRARSPRPRPPSLRRRLVAPLRNRTSPRPRRPRACCARLAPPPTPRPGRRPAPPGRRGARGSPARPRGRFRAPLGDGGVPCSRGPRPRAPLRPVASCPPSCAATPRGASSPL